MNLIGTLASLDEQFTHDSGKPGGKEDFSGLVQRQDLLNLKFSLEKNSVDPYHVVQSMEASE